jgi:hypothetical protein
MLPFIKWTVIIGYMLLVVMALAYYAYLFISFAL